MASSSVQSSPPEFCDGPAQSHKSSPTYTNYLRVLCSRNPSLQTLYYFLSNPKARANGCRVTALDFRDGIVSPTLRRNLYVDCLSQELRRGRQSSVEDRLMSESHALQGRILIIEDLTAGVLEMLGSELDIDPLFLAMHLHTVQRTGMRHQPPDEATLPSRFEGRDYINISYHRPMTSGDVYPLGARLIRDTAVDRKLVFLRSTNIGLAQHHASILKVHTSEDFWIALILVDPPISNAYFLAENKDNDAHKVYVDLKPFKGVYEDFAELPKFSENWADLKTLPQGGMMEDLVRYWGHASPACFDPRDPTIQSIAYYPLRIIAAEWVKYIWVMRHCIKMYEFQGSHLANLDKFDTDIRELQSWRRRTLTSRQKIKSVLRNLESHHSSDIVQCTAIRQLTEDFKVIISDIENAGQSLENMLLVVTSLVQIIDARQSYAETANISRLTILALVFVPLGYISSLFSMNPGNMPGSQHFWVYFAVAVPVTVIVFIMARPPTGGVRITLAWLRGRRDQRPTLDQTHETNLAELRAAKV